MAARGYEFYPRVLRVSLMSERSERVRDTSDFKIVDNGRLGRLDAYTGDLGRVR